MRRLYKAYQKLYASMHDKATGPHKTQFRRDEDYGELPSNLITLVWRDIIDRYSISVKFVNQTVVFVAHLWVESV